jgi:hypothetical protein
MFINSSRFNFSFFLSDRKKVSSLESGAIAYGGSTKFQSGIYSNIPGTENIKVNNRKNSISIFIPSTINVNQPVNNKQYIAYASRYLNRFYPTANSVHYNTQGSWYSEDNNQVVIENITIMTIELETVSETDISIFIELAKYIKQAMNQEGVSIAINTALAIV